MSFKACAGACLVTAAVVTSVFMLRDRALQAEEQLATRMALEGASQRADAVDRSYQRSLINNAERRIQELSHVDSDQAARAARLRGRDLRLWVDAASCVSGATGDTSTTGHTAHAELAPEVAVDLEAIAFDGDRAIIDLNTCISDLDDARRSVAAWVSATSTTPRK